MPLLLLLLLFTRCSGDATHGARVQDGPGQVCAHHWHQATRLKAGAGFGMQCLVCTVLWGLKKFEEFRRAGSCCKGCAAKHSSH